MNVVKHIYIIIRVNVYRIVKYSEAQSEELYSVKSKSGNRFSGC